MSEVQLQLKNFFENYPLYKEINISVLISSINPTSIKLREIEYECPNCECKKPLHNDDSASTAVILNLGKKTALNYTEFTCVSCQRFSKLFILNLEKVENSILKITKIGEYPQKQLKRNKELAKFFKSDKEEYNKAVICISHGYGVAAFAYMRRIIENNIHQLLDMIAEDDMADNSIKVALAELRNESPMSQKIAIANKALPSYLMINGHNPLGAMYKVLSEGVHSLSDDECLRRTEAVQNCLEYIISGLATHKKSKEAFKDNLDLLKSF